MNGRKEIQGRGKRLEEEGRDVKEGDWSSETELKSETKRQNVSAKNLEYRT